MFDFSESSSSVWTVKPHLMTSPVTGKSHAPPAIPEHSRVSCVSRVSGFCPWRTGRRFTAQVSSALRGGCIKVWHMWMSFCFCPSFMSSPPPFIFYQTTSPLTWWSPSGLWCSGEPVVGLTCMSSKTYRGSGPALVGEVEHWGRVPIKRSFSPDQLVWVHPAETSRFRLIMEFFCWSNCPSMGGVIIRSRLSPPGVDFTCRLFFFHCVCFTVIGCQSKKLVG